MRVAFGPAGLWQRQGELWSHSLEAFLPAPCEAGADPLAAACGGEKEQGLTHTHAFLWHPNPLPSPVACLENSGVEEGPRR